MLMTFTTITALTLTLSDSAKAGENLNFAATIVSIILAVIAIIYTFVDSGGQKQNILQLQETAKNLQNSLVEMKETNEIITNQLKEVTDLKDELITAVGDTVEWRNQVLSKLDNISEKNGSEKDKQINEFKEFVQKSALDFSNRSSRSRIRDTIIRQYKKGDIFCIEALLEKLRADNLYFPKSDVHHALALLRAQGFYKRNKIGLMKFYE